ncbi:MAG TPA: hypothetical protein VFP94_03790 [Terriglobales bacterium]|nr:hypothetical protein [Terriglobales bacterium]
MLCSSMLPAQILASGTFGFPAQSSNPHLANATAMGKLGISLPPVPHALVMWNILGLGFDRWQQQPGASLETGMEVWLSPARRPVQSHSPLVLAEAALGRRWGQGLHGYKAIGAGLGWSLGDWVPYAEYRRRTSFHAGRPVDNQILIGVHFVLFG